MLYDCPDNKTMNTKTLHPHPLISLLPLAVLIALITLGAPIVSRRCAERSLTGGTDGGLVGVRGPVDADISDKVDRV